MGKRFLLLVLIGLSGAASAQSDMGPFRLGVRHADPWSIKAMIEGLPTQSPERSTIPGFAGVLSNATAQAVRQLQSGYLVVNPTDNSLWYFPKR